MKYNNNKYMKMENRFEEMWNSFEVLWVHYFEEAQRKERKKFVSNRIQTKIVNNEDENHENWKNEKNTLCIKNKTKREWRKTYFEFKDNNEHHHSFTLAIFLYTPFDKMDEDAKTECKTKKKILFLVEFRSFARKRKKKKTKEKSFGCC